jgi:glycosyltransferase involved in cell wall biosynthesis
MEKLIPTEETCITAIVPARNEAAVIEACLRSLAAQPEITEIIVVDDQSSDATPQIVRRLAADFKQIRLLNVDCVPSGWSGKNNAVCLGARQAHQRWLLFTDADAELEPGAATRALQVAGQTGAALVSFSSEQITETWYEKALIPFVYARLAKHFSFEAVNDPKNEAAAANGQFLMIRHDAYEAVGGHASVAGEVLEDVALAVQVKSAGYQLWFGSGDGIVRVRMYRSFRAMWDGWRKNLYLLIGGTSRALLLEFARVAPWPECVLFIASLWFSRLALPGAAILMLRHLAYGLALARNQSRVGFILYYVPAVFLYVGLLMASYRAYRSGKVEWKGRSIAVGGRPVGAA